MKNRWRRSLCCFVICLLLAAPACASASAPKPAENAAGMPLVPDFTLPCASGGDVSLSDFAGKQVVLYFWASWCFYCKQGFPEKQALHDWMRETEFPGAILAVNLTDGMQETRASCDAYIAENGFTLPVLYDETGALSAPFTSSGIPVVVVIDAEGYLKGGSIGSMPLDELQALLEREP